MYRDAFELHSVLSHLLTPPTSSIHHDQINGAAAAQASAEEATMRTTAGEPGADEIVSYEGNAQVLLGQRVTRQ